MHSRREPYVEMTTILATCDFNKMLFVCGGRSGHERAGSDRNEISQSD